MTKVQQVLGLFGAAYSTYQYEAVISDVFMQPAIAEAATKWG